MFIFSNRSLLNSTFFRKSYGRDCGNGSVLLRFRGGGLYRKYRVILFNYPSNFKRIYVANIYKDYLFRTAYIAKVLFEFSDFVKKYYIIVHSKTNCGDIYYNMCNYNLDDLNWDYFSMHAGNLYCVKNLPVGTLIYNLERFQGIGGSLIRAAGCFGVVMKQDLIEKKTIIKLPSKQMLTVPFLSRALLGIVSNENFRFFNCRIAGYSRNFGKRPHVRGVAMNSTDHPHGGGRGKTKGGRPSVSLWGWLTKGKKTVYLK